MFHLLKVVLFSLAFLFFAAPAQAAGACEAPRPESPALDLLIKEAQARGGAAAAVNAKVLKAIYEIEASTAYVFPDQYSCQYNAAGALGLMQIKDDIYKTVVPQTEQAPDEGICSATNCKLSRCNAVDAIEIAARVLLYKIFLWDETADKPLGKLTSATDAYYASCRYYGSFAPDDLTNELAKRLPPNKVPADGKMSYCEYVTLYSGLYTSPSQLPSRTDKPYSGAKSSVKFTFDACTSPIAPPIPTNFKVHPLRPNPDDPISADAPLTAYCAMRPTPVEMNRFDKREEFIDIKTVGTLTQDFTNFITPLLSITDPKKTDYSLPFSDKAQRYMADFLEGRAYYEPFIEPTNPTPTQQADLFNRLGVFRKLAPKTYQDELKRALIQRAAGSFSDNPYGFEPASTTIHNYTVGSWQGQTVTLKDFVNNWAPIPKDFPDGGYEQAHEDWKNLDGGKWASLWPYVPMFTREDSVGTIEIIDSNPPPDPYSPSGQFIEQNKSNPNQTEVSHPHLARTFEVATSLSYLLTPQAVHEGATPPELGPSTVTDNCGTHPTCERCVQELSCDKITRICSSTYIIDESPCYKGATPPYLGEEWIPKLWEGTIWWLDPSYKKPNLDLTPPLEFGPLCDVDPGYISLITSSGDQALDSVITTSVNRQDLQVPNPEYDPSTVTDNCGTHPTCERCVQELSCDKITRICSSTYIIDESRCFYYKEIRSNPNYLITYTPFLTEILTSLTGSQRAVFDLFKPFGAPEQPYEKYDWPGVGNAGEESPEYSFEASSGESSRAEAGAKKPGDSQSYYYRYLGSLQCAKERVMQVLQPFISGSPYEPFAYECFPELTPTTDSTDPLPTGPKWLQWPMRNVNQPLTQCFRDTRNNGTHAGIDMVGSPDAAPVYPGAPGNVVNVNFSSVFGYYVIIHHDNNWNTIYAHLQPNILVSRGDVVNVNTTLGYQDSTGTPTYSGPMELHLHFGLSKGSSEADFYYTASGIADPCAAIQGCSCNSTGN